MGRAGAARLIGGMRGLAFALVALAILLRIFIPAGWMPSSGTIGITMCTGYGTVRVAMAVPGQHDGKAEAAAREHPCAFAGLAAPFAEPDGALPVLPATPVAVLFVAMACAVAIGRGLAAPPPPQTGPPASL